MTEFARSDLESLGFTGFARVFALQRDDGCSRIGSQPGVYVVYRDSDARPRFRCRGECGPHRHRNPNVDTQLLRAKWVCDACVLYIGKTRRPLRKRIAEYMKAGQGKNHGHWGGRFIWQLQDCDELLIAWKPTPDENPHTVEKALILKFEQQYGRLPFANLRRG